MNLSSMIKWGGTISSLLVIINWDYNGEYIESASGKGNTSSIRNRSGNRRLAAVSSGSYQLPRHLNPKNYQTPNGCDFSEFVQRFKPEEMELNCSNIHEVKLGKLLGVGFWREVYEGEWHGQKVALKRLLPQLVRLDDEKILNDLTHTAAVLFQLRESPNINRMVGWCDTTIVLEKGETSLDVLISLKHYEISVQKALEMSLDIAKAVKQMHTIEGGPVVHNDIKPQNFLVGANGNLLLTDFNMMQFAGKSKEGTKCSYQGLDQGPFQSPEEKLLLPANEKADIFSAALVMWALRSRHRQPYPVPREERTQLIMYGLRPDVTEMIDYPQAMQDLIVQAWDINPAKRPSATEMVDRIETILRDHINQEV